MHLGKIIGTVVSTVKFRTLKGVKLLLVQPLDFKLKERDDALVMTDMMRSGPGQIVFYVESREASMMMEKGRTFAPVDHAIVGHIDSVYYDPPAENSQYIKNKLSAIREKSSKTSKKSEVKSKISDIKSTNQLKKKAKSDKVLKKMKKSTQKRKKIIISNKKQVLKK